MRRNPLHVMYKYIFFDYSQPQVQYVKMEDLTQIAFCNPSDYANIHRLVTMDLLRWAHEIAEGMHYLSIKKVKWIQQMLNKNLSTCRIVMREILF
jgi:hypothetical protein